jgi:ABC-type nitrate/sulfonate/bicarbonate transport system permease component
MIHSGRHLRIYHRKHHFFIAGGVILLSILFLAILGGFTDINIAKLSSGIGISLYRLIIGYLISLTLGVGIAIFLEYAAISEFFMPVLDVLQNVPSFALIPVFAIAFGYTNTMAIIFAATSIIWPILFYVLSALTTARKELNEAATVFGAVGEKRIWNYLVPLSFPAIITGSIVGISIGWEAVIGIEIIGLSSGVGVFLSQASSAGDRNTLLLGIVAILLVVFAINKLIWTPLIKKTHYYAE